MHDCSVPASTLRPRHVPVSPPAVHPGPLLQGWRPQAGCQACPWAAAEPVPRCRYAQLMAQQQAKHEAQRAYNRERLHGLQRPFEFDTRVSALLAAKRAAALQPAAAERPGSAAPRAPTLAGSRSTAPKVGSGLVRSPCAVCCRRAQMPMRAACPYSPSHTGPPFTWPRAAQTGCAGGRSGCQPWRDSCCCAKPWAV